MRSKTLQRVSMSRSSFAGCRRRHDLWCHVSHVAISRNSSLERHKQSSFLFFPVFPHLRLGSYCIPMSLPWWQQQQDGRKRWSYLRRQPRCCFEREYLQSYEAWVAFRTCLSTADAQQTLLLFNSKLNNSSNSFCSCYNNQPLATMIPKCTRQKPRFSWG